MPLDSFPPFQTLLFKQLEAAQPPENPEEWIELTTAIDALRSLLEDSYVDWTEGLAEEVKRVQGSAVKDSNALISLIIEIAKLDPLPYETELRTVPCGSTKADYILRRAIDGNRGFLLSTGEVRNLPVLDDTLTDWKLAPGLIDAYVEAVKIAQQKYKITYLAFIDKNFGPIGALGLISALVSRTKLPAVIHRERKWSKKADFSRYRPKPGERGVIIYDLVNTGAAIRATADRIAEEFTAPIAATIVLYNLSETITEIAVSRGRPVVVLALDGAKGPSGCLQHDVNLEEREVASSRSDDDSRSFPRGEEMAQESNSYDAESPLSYRERLQKILESPQAAAEAFPNPEIRSKALPLYDSLMAMSDAPKE